MAHGEGHKEGVHAVWSAQKWPDVSSRPRLTSSLLPQGTRREEMQEGRRLIERAIQEEYAARRVRTVDEQGRAYASGKRKTSIARVWIWEGPGSISINGRSLDMYFPQLNRRAEVLAPFQVTLMTPYLCTSCHGPAWAFSR